jgi:hypothetical protein
MKTVKILCTVIFATLLLAGCQKDEDGIRYYKQPTGEGYVFVKNADGTITPFANKENILALEASGNSGSGLFDAFWEHTDIYSTDANGKFTCKFVRKIDRHDVQYYRIYLTLNAVINENVLRMDVNNGWHGYYCVNKDFSKNEIIIIDTIFITLRN